jgi:hypothetical protein
MSESHWRNMAAPIIRRVLAEHAGEDEAAIRAALRDAWPWGPRKHHPYRIWCDEVARQQGRKPEALHGTLPQRPSDPDPRQGMLFPPPQSSIAPSDDDLDKVPAPNGNPARTVRPSKFSGGVL